MGLPSVMQTGQSGMHAAKTAIATSGHNITNANTEGFSRQRVETENRSPVGAKGTNVHVGRGTHVTAVNRINDEYLEKQLRNGERSLGEFEEKDFVLKQVESIFNEMDGDGLNRLMSRFFNDFRRLSNDPDNDAVRQAVRESSRALVSDLRRMRSELKEVGRHIDSRLSGFVTEANDLVEQIQKLNFEIRKLEVSGHQANDLNDQRDVALKKLGSYLNISTHKDEHGSIIVDVKGIGPLVTSATSEKFGVKRTPADGRGKAEAAYDITTTASANAIITHNIQGGKLGGLLNVRDKTLSAALERLDDLAYNLSNAVNAIHVQGVNRSGLTGISFFQPLITRERAAEAIDLSDSIKNSVNNIASGSQLNAPGDNRIALAISGLQGARLMSDGKVTMDDFYNSIVSDVGVVLGRNKESLNQQKNIMTQLSKMRDQISGVSLDEETANLLQFQHAFDASAKVIQVADHLLEEVLNLKR